MKTVLIPTDFTLQSLDIVKAAARRFAAQQLNIVLFHALHIPTDIQDLLFMSKTVPHEKLTESFRHACAAIKKKHSYVIAQITFRHLHGSTPAVFRNFIEANGIDLIFMPAHTSLTPPYDNSVDVLPLFKKATVPFITDTDVAEVYQPIAQKQHRGLTLAGE